MLCTWSHLLLIGKYVLQNNATMPHLKKMEGRVIAIGTFAAQLRLVNSGDYGTRKFALWQRLLECTQKKPENPKVKAFVYPYIPDTKASNPDPAIWKDAPADAIALPAASILYFSMGKADWLNGR